jgi:cytochrome c-type biogenesis protein CcmH/NrfF
MNHLSAPSRVLSPITPTVLAGCARWGAPIGATRWCHALRLVVLAALVFSSNAFAQSAKTQLKDPALATRFNEVSDRLVCQCGCNMILQVCNHVNCPSAVPMRHSIETQLLAGAPNDSIVAGFVGEYGLKVLSSPPTSGFNLAAWVMPGFALLVGLFAAVYLSMRWAAKRRVAVATPAGPIDPELKRRIEDEMKSV